MFQSAAAGEAEEPDDEGSEEESAPGGGPPRILVVGGGGAARDDEEVEMEGEEEEEDGALVDEPEEEGQEPVTAASAVAPELEGDAAAAAAPDDAPAVAEGEVAETQVDAEGEEEEEEEEAEEADQTSAPAQDRMAAATAAARMLVQGAADEPEEEEDEDEAMEEEDGEEPEPAMEDAMTAAAATARMLVRGAADEPEEQMQLVARDEDEPEESCEAPIVLAEEGHRDGSGQVVGLPAEAFDGWTVSGEFCHLQVAGKGMKLPRSIYDRLYGYQRQGVAWMWNLFHKRFGGILGDEMGMGKTVQTAAFLSCLKCTDHGRYFLIVMTVNLMEQWKRELATWSKAANLPVHMYHNSPAEKAKALMGLRRRGGVLITSYETARQSMSFLQTAGLACAASGTQRKRKRQTTRATRDDDSPSEAEEDVAALPMNDPQTPWDVVILDEGQTIKNPFCVNGKALRRLEAHSRIVLTGTPVSNNLSDLWSLMDFAQPSLLGNHATFDQKFAHQIAKGSHKNASKFDVELKNHLVKELRKLTDPHFLRRMKSEVNKEALSRANAVDAAGSRDGADAAAETSNSQEVPKVLPKKVDVVFFVKLTSAQNELYHLYLNSETVQSACGAEKIGMEALRAINQLKAICGHPLLCLPQDELAQWIGQIRAMQAGKQGAVVNGDSAADAGVPEETQDVGTQPAAECHNMLSRVRALVPNSAHGGQLLSCKLRVLSVLLPQLHKRGHRCCIFAESRGMLDLIQVCVLRTLGLRFLRIDGTIDPRDRDAKVKKFQAPDSKYFAICMTVQTGGTGLTITGADRVILVNPHWNPMVDAQAIDRVHRIGQTRDVVVYRLIGAGAIEDKMFRLQVFKRGLARAVLDEAATVRFFTKKDLKALFERPDRSTSTQTLMSRQIGQEAYEHAEMLKVVMADVGDVQDSQAEAFWQSSDVEGFSDYQRISMFLEQHTEAAEDVQDRARDLAEQLRSERYIKEQVVKGRVRAHARDADLAEDAEDTEQTLVPLQDQAPAPIQDG